MAGFDGSGNYVRPYSWVQDAANGINITASRFDDDGNDVAAAFDICVTRDGQGKMDTDFLPATDNTLDLGSISKRWASLNGVPLLGLIVNVQQFGAKGDGATDDAAAIQNALNSGVASVYLPPLHYRCASGITVPVGVSLYSFGFQPGNAPTGARLTFDLSVPTCLTMGGSGASNGSCSIDSFSVLRAAGTPPSGSIGVLNQNTYATIITKIASMGHQIPVKFQGDRGSLGATCMVSMLFTGAAYDAHVVIDTFPEVRFNQCRLGMDGPGDQACNAYVRIIGGSTTNAANGPGTMVWLNTQFNQGQNSVAHGFSWENQLSGSISDTTVWQFIGCYMEDAGDCLHSDNTWTAIGRLMMSSFEFSASSTTPFMNLDPATQINNWAFSNVINFGAFTLNQTPQTNFLTVTGGQIAGITSITNAANSCVNFVGVTFEGNLVLAGAQGNCSYSGSSVTGVITRSGITSGAPLISIGTYNDLTTWTPNVQFGGASVGMTFSVQQATYQIVGDRVYLDFFLQFTAKGSSTGTATISNPPVVANGAIAGGAGGGSVNQANNMTGLVGAIAIEVSSVINLFQWNATGMTTVTDANFSNTTLLRGTFSYLRA